MITGNAVRGIDEAREEMKVEDEAVKKMAMPVLKAHSNIVELADECTVIKMGNGARIRGNGRDAGGNVHSFLVEWDIAKFNGQETWQLETVQIDGRNRRF